MKIPNSFNKAIKETFYDKEIDIYTDEEQDDGAGFVTRGVEPTGKIFYGNVQYSNLEQMQKDYGLSEQVDIVISTSETIQAGSVVGYDGRLFKIIKAIPNDSHNLLIGTVWQQLSSGLISS